MAINDGLAKLSKYYSWFDEKPAYVIALGMSFFRLRCYVLPSIYFSKLYPLFPLHFSLCFTLSFTKILRLQTLPFDHL